MTVARCLFAALLCLAPLVGVSRAAADEPQSGALPALEAVAASGARPHRAASVGGDSKDGPAESKPSEAERIARLQRALEVDEKYLLELKTEFNRPEGEYQKADAEFKSLDAELEEQKKQADQHPPSDPEAAGRQQAERADRQRKWELAKQRFELAIQERKALQASIATLEQKLTTDREALDRLLNPADPEPVAVQPPPVTPPEPAAKIPARSDDANSAAAGVNALARLIPGLMPPAVSAGPDALPVAPAANAAKPNSKELKAAAEEARRKEAAAEEAQAEARSLTARTEILARNIELERTLLDTAHKKVDNAEQTLASVENEFNQKLLAGVEPPELYQLRQKIAEADARVREARAETRARSGQLDSLHSELAALQAEQIAALREADELGAAAKSAQQRLVQLRNPFSPRNLLEWLFVHGPRIAAILLAMGCFVWLYRGIEARLVELLAHRPGRGTPEERENRAKTLVGVAHNAAGVLILSGGILMLLDEIGIPIAPLMGGAAVIGLAVAFGAQSLIKDCFSGFMILLEQQYLINDVVKIGDIAGQVERITLRMTVLRDLEGRVHFLPHGEITRVTNMTHGWSRAVFDISVAYKEDVDRVMNVLVELGRQLREDPEYYNVILEEPEMLGVDLLGDSAVVIKFCIKTRPLKQWLVKRELLRRIKNKFDQLGIEIPYPSHTLFHRHEASAAPPATAHEESRWGHHAA